MNKNKNTKIKRTKTDKKVRKIGKKLSDIETENEEENINIDNNETDEEI